MAKVQTERKSNKNFNDKRHKTGENMKHEEHKIQ